MAAFDQMCILGNKSLSCSNLSSGSLPAEKASPEIASGANKICWQKLHSRPGIALFLHNRPTDAIFGSTLAQLLERKVLFARPRYGFFGGQFIPLATDFPVEVEAPGDGAFPSSGEPQCRHCFSCPDRQRGLLGQEGSMIFGRIAPDVIF